MLSDDPIAWFQGNYLLYPQRLDVVQSVDGFTVADLDAHAGGCLFFYRSQADRLEHFHDRLAQVHCSRDGCLYGILSAAGQ